MTDAVRITLEKISAYASMDLAVVDGMRDFGFWTERSRDPALPIAYGASA